VVRADGDPRTEGGARNLVAVAKHHSMLLQKIRGIGPLVPMLMGMDMCMMGVARWKSTSGSQPSKLRTTISS
jgi:hypothetical protein